MHPPDASPLQGPLPTAAPAGGGGPSWRGAAWAATRWGGAGLVAGTAGTFALAAPLYPFEDAGGWDQLGWFVVTALAAVAVALVAGAAGVVVGLRRGGHPRTTATAVTFVPVALLLAAVTAGVGALAAPAVACWLVAGFAPTAGGRVPAAGSPQPVPPTSPRRGLAQRVVVVLVVCGLVTSVLLDQLGLRLGGRDRGELLVWAACLPALVAVPAVLLGRRVPVAATAGLVGAMAALTATAVPPAVASAHPSPDRLFRSVAQLPVPQGYTVTSHDRAVTSGSADAGLGSTSPRSTGPDRPLPVNVVTIAPAGAPAPAVPPALRPDDRGRLPWPDPGDLRVLGVDLRSTPSTASTTAGRAAAARWEQLLLDDGWRLDATAGLGPPSGEAYWLPPAVRRVVDARPRLERGPWVRASVVPVGDGAVLVVSVRP